VLRAQGKKTNGTFLALLVACLLLVPVSSPWAYSGKVVDVPQGDLLVVSVGGSAQKIRLYGIECPVFGQPFHDKARFMANYISLQRNVEITPVFKDHDGIENALVRIEGVADYLNNQLVGYGLAWVKPCDSKSRLCEEWKKQEGFAQMNFIGLWAQPRAISPWEWKKAQRMQIYERSKGALKPPK
jgi:endonuclease YncB( thermonuclease family)